MLFPLALFLGAALDSGVDETGVLRLVLALVVTAAGVLIGVLLERRGERERHPRHA